MSGRLGWAGKFESELWDEKTPGEPGPRCREGDTHSARDQGTPIGAPVMFCHIMYPPVYKIITQLLVCLLTLSLTHPKFQNDPWLKLQNPKSTVHIPHLNHRVLIFWAWFLFFSQFIYPIFLTRKSVCVSLLDGLDLLTEFWGTGSLNIKLSTGLS